MHQANHSIRNIIGLFLCAAVMVGCTAVQSFSVAARQGDTITLALGSAEGMTKTNITVEYYSDSAPATAIDLTSYVIGLFKLYPDKTSKAWLEDTSANAGRSAHGAWLTILAINLPDAGVGILPVGTGHIEVTTAPGEVTVPRFHPHVDDVDIALEILAGNGSPNPLLYADFVGGTIAGDMALLEPRPQVVVKPPVPIEGQQYATTYGAVEINLTAEMRDFFGDPITDAAIRVIADDQVEKETNQLQTLWTRNGDDFTIMFVSPVGFYPHQIRASIVPNVNDPLPGSINGVPSVMSIAYYDIDGVLTTGPTPTVVIE